jgi:hypothetical protein
MTQRIGRRAFAETLLVLPVGLFLLRCGSSDASSQSDGTGGTPSSGANPPSAAPVANGSQVTYTSSDSGGHSHTYSIDVSAFTAPPAAGLSGETSNDEGHTHTVAVSAAQLSQIGAGQSIQVTTGSTSGHTHVFTFVKLG